MTMPPGAPRAPRPDGPGRPGRPGEPGRPGRSPTRRERGRALARLDPGRFASYADYYFAIHLNPAVRAAHVAGMLLALAAAATGIAARDWRFAVPYLFFVIGVPQLSHWVFDAFRSPAIEGSRGGSLFMALRLNFGTMLGLHARRERVFRDRYPFVREIYPGGTPETAAAGEATPAPDLGARSGD